jgi:hypothetical protein
MGRGALSPCIQAALNQIMVELERAANPDCTQQLSGRLRLETVSVFRLNDGREASAPSIVDVDIHHRYLSIVNQPPRPTLVRS